MAAEVPVTDVLCEAMEYLSKLGTNLRSRSESLKEKRITKNKLRNSHAISKAANKVLLICQLSKKSLDNVETGVRRVLAHIDTIQNATRDGGKSMIKSPHSSESSNYRFFEFESKKLRVLKKVPLKHYLSAKVLAKSMPLSMQDKYPVFYDCKLFRLRKRNTAVQNVSIDSGNKIPSKLSEKESIDKSKNKKVGSTSPSSKDNDERLQPNVEVENPEKVKKNFENKSTNSSIQEEKDKEKEKKKGSDESSDKSDSIKANKDKKNETNSERRGSSKDTCKPSHRKRIKNIDENSNSSAASITKENDTNTIEKVDKNKRSISDSESCDKGHRSKKQKLDTESDSKKFNQVISLDSDTEDLNEKTSTENTENEKIDSKPLIKCVSLNKLLKPEVLGDHGPISNKKDSNVTEGKSTDKEHNKNGKKLSMDEQNTQNIRSDKVRNQSSDKDYLEQKRKEVKEFKSRRFTINITRLPKFSIKFLHDHHLKTIIQNNSVIFGESKNSNEHQKAVDNNNSDNDSCNSRKSMKRSKNAPSSDLDQSTVNKVKNALLNDSDLDIGKEDEHNKKIQAKTSNTIDEQDSGSAKDSNDSKNTQNVAEAMINESDLGKPDKEVTNLTENITKMNEVIKNSLLKDSDSDSNDIPPEKKKEHNCNVHSENDTELNAEVENLKNKLLKSDSAESETDIQTRGDKKTENPKDPNPNVHDVCNEKDRDNLQNPPIDVNTSDKEKEKETNGSPQHNNDESPRRENNTPKSSDVDAPGTPLSQRRKRNQSETPKSKRKHIMESMHAKKMLLNYSSSDTEDEQLKDALMEIKKDLLKELSSDEERATNKLVEFQRNRATSSSSDDDISRIVKPRKKKKRKHNSSSSESGHSKAEQAAKDTCNSQSDEDADEKLISSSSEMVRSKAKPGNCSSQNSDNQDSSDKDIDRLTNINTLNSSHRRESSSPEPTRSSRRKDQAAKALIGEELLKAESSDAASMADSDAEHEDLPEVQMPGLNGTGIERLAKDDLLGESDSSASHEKEKSSEELQNTEETDDENVKLRRRKAIAISSDSEVGSSRKKEVRSSDFEDSEDDGSETGKKTKRKKRDPDSDASGSSSNDGSKKKRRRIKQVNDSDLSGSDTENEGRNKHGRKNIRKVMGKNQLEEATKKAAREEKERIARISERQKLYNNLEFDESGKPDEVVLEKVVLDFDPETKEPLVEVDRGLVKKLKPHQANGIKFMWDACFESVKRMKKDKGSGCILAHCMGLGKTLQVVSLTHTLLTHGSLTGVNRVLVVCPLSTVLNWVNEFNMWLKHANNDYDVEVYELSRYKQNSERAFQLQQWFTHGGVCVLGYEMFRNLSADNSKKYKKKMLRHFQESLVDPGPDLVVCDEGHLLKNEKTSLSQSMNRVRTRRRIVLTGTPLQNNLKEYYCMVQFVKPNLLGKYNEYLNRFVNPITNGQYTDSTEQDIRVMKRRSHVLHKMLDGAVQRRDYGVLAPFLPPKHEYVLFITLSEVQVALYQFYLDNYSRRPLAGKSSGFLFPDFQSLQRIWTHPLVLKYNSERYEIMQQKKRDKEEEDSEGSLVDFIDDDSTPDESTTEDSTDSDSDVSDDSRKKSKKKKSAKKGKGKDTRGSRRGTRANPVEIEDVDEVAEIVEVKSDNPTEWWIPLVTDEVLEDMRNSHKLVLLFDILKHCEAIGDKLLVFSQSLYSLDLIEHFLGKVDEATQEARIDDKLGGHVGSWSPGVDYFRLDGSTSCENRSIWCKNFNREDNPRARLFLISTRAGGLGINLVAANRVVIFDVSWNPSHDVQSIFRVYRFGQKKPCYVYRFLAMGTMEEKIYERQVTKQAISKRVIDEQQIDRHYAENDLAELYKFEPTPPSPRPLPPLPKDRLFAEMLKEHEAEIYKYHEHDSLLENKEEETLSEEERKAAWEDFENEKSRPPPQPFPSPWPMHNGLVPGLVAQQQQQLAYATLAAMLKKDVPNITDNQIRDMLPLIYNSNPGMFGGYDYGLMQKLSDIYKYPQAAMMNPAMMNPAMNSGAASGGVSGGASGLQYEPPWQRQLQQQQQLRLQQLMQQQQNMGAKFYAGGLGSRDPVAMALQQQRAREIMVSGAGRPRGRPPLQPRLPAAPHDVVNLDSD